MNKWARRGIDDRICKYYTQDQRLEDMVVLDVGSYDINGSLKNVIPVAWTYIGLDRVPGPNVDVVAEEGKPFPIGAGSVGLVVSSSCFQYVKNPFELTRQLYACLKPGGMIYITAAYTEKEGLLSLPPELCPNEDIRFDCWRFYKDGMRAVLEEAGFTVEDVAYDEGACWGTGRKPE